MSSEPHFFHRIHNVWNSIIAFPRFEYEGNLPLPSPSIIITRTRCLTLTVPQSHGSARLPLYHVNATETEKLDHQPITPKIPLNLLPKLVSLIFNAAALGNQTMSTSLYQPSIVGVAMVISFVALLSLLLVSNKDTIKHSYQRLAVIVEKIGYLSLMLSVLLVAKVFFSGNIILWIIVGGVAMAWTMLALHISFST